MLKIEVIERRVYIVPEILESEVAGAIDLKDSEYLEELISTLEYRVGADEISTISAKKLEE